MTQQQELQVLLRTVAQTNGADQVSNALGRVRREASGARESGGGLQQLFNTGSEGALRFAGALTGVEIGLSIAASAGRALKDALSADAFIEAARIARAIAASYGSNAESFNRFSASLAAQSGFTRTAILDAALSARTLSENYGLSITQTQKLIAVSANLAQVRGIGVAEAFERIQSAIRGEAEASEFLGLTLNATFLQQHAANGAYRETFTTLTDAQRAQIVYGEVLRQSAGFEGLAAQSTQGLEGAQRRASQASQELSQDIGQLLSRQVQIATDDFARLTRAVDEFVKTAGQGTAEERRAAQALETRRQIGELLLQVGIVQNQFGTLSDQSSGKMVNVEEIADRLKVSWDDLLAVMEAGGDKFSGSSEGLDLVRGAIQRLLPPVQQVVLALVRTDETLKSADLSTARWTRDLEALRDASATASNLLDALGTSTATAGQRAALAAENDLRTILNVSNAMTIAAQSSLRAQEAIASHISDPRDAIGGSNRVAQQRLALLDQLEPAEQRLLDARQRQNDLTQESIRLQAQEAAQTLASLTTSEHLQDVQDRLRLDQLNLQLRGTLSPEQRTATRRDIRDINRRQLPQAERDALLAEIGLRPIQRAEGRTRLLGQIAGADVGAGQANLDAIIAQGVTAGITAAATKNPTQVNLHIDISGADGSSQVFDQLIEANGQAQTPPTIQVSAVRR